MPFTGDTNKIEHTHAELRQQNCACWIWNSVNVPQLSMHKSHWIHRNPLVHKSPWWLCIHLPTCFTTDLHQWQQHKRACMSIFVDLCVCLWPLSLLQIVCMQMHHKQQGRMSLSASALKAEVERWREKPAQDWRWTFVLWDCSYIWCLCYTASCSEIKSCWMLNLQSISGLCVEPSEETINTATLWCKPEERECGADTDLYLRLQQ